MAKRRIKKAYENPGFLRGPDARTVRILSEYLEPQARLRRRKIQGAIVFFGSSKTLSLENAAKSYGRSMLDKRYKSESAENSYSQRQIRLARYYEDARLLANRITTWTKEIGIDRDLIVCSGGGPGMMEAANRGATEAKGASLGLTISLPNEPQPNAYISSGLEIEFHYFFMRKFWFMYLAKVLVVFPGGYGTMDELFEVLTLLQTQKVQRRVEVIVYGSEYWNSVVNFESLVDWGTISSEDLNLIHRVDDVEEAFTIIKRAIGGT